MAFRAVRNDVAAEIEAGSTVKLSWLKHFGDQPTPTVSYTHFAGLVAREITGKVGSRGGRATAKLSSPHEASVLDQPAAVPLPNPQPALSPEKRQQPNDSQSQVRQQPKRIVTRVPDIERILYGSKGKLKE
ncbi:hypothetical protein [Acidiphilium multivorum]|nr:hypothetical protein [Acidiphilium multivorum]